MTRTGRLPPSWARSRSLALALLLAALLAVREAAPRTVAFTPADWNRPRTVTAAVGSTNEVVDPEGFRRTTITHTASGAKYDGIPIAGVTVTVNDGAADGDGYGRVPGARRLSLALALATFSLTARHGA